MNHNTTHIRNKNKTQPEDGLGRPKGVGPSHEGYRPEPSTIYHVTFRTGHRQSGGNREHRQHPYRREIRTSPEPTPEPEERMSRMFWEYLRREQLERGIEARVSSPFTKSIEAAPTPREWKMPTMDPYKGTLDPIIHLQCYSQHMLMNGAIEGVLCKCFPLFLSGLATTWFCRLPHGSISSWEMLKEKFISQFRIHVEQSRDAYSLSDIKQKA